MGRTPYGGKKIQECLPCKSQYINHLTAEQNAYQNYGDFLGQLSGGLGTGEPKYSKFKFGAGGLLVRPYGPTNNKTK